MRGHCPSTVENVCVCGGVGGEGQLPPLFLHPWDMVIIVVMEEIQLEPMNGSWITKENGYGPYLQQMSYLYVKLVTKYNDQTTSIWHRHIIIVSNSLGENLSKLRMRSSSESGLFSVCDLSTSFLTIVH